MKQLIFAGMIAFTLIGCGPSTKIVKTWQEPGATVTQAAENKTLVISMVKDESSRRVIEDQLVKRMKGETVVSYSMLTPDLLKQANEAKRRMVYRYGSNGKNAGRWKGDCFWPGYYGT